MRDHDYNQPAGNTYAYILRSTFYGTKQFATTARIPESGASSTLFPVDVEETRTVDAMAKIEQQVTEALHADSEIKAKLESDQGIPWYGFQQFLMNQIPEHVDDRQQFAYNLVPKVLNSVYGNQNQAWETFKNPSTGKTWVKARG
jgi:hypothetical protein